MDYWPAYSSLGLANFVSKANISWGVDELAAISVGTYKIATVYNYMIRSKSW